jgi:hypothetical protein
MRNVRFLSHSRQIAKSARVLLALSGATLVAPACSGKATCPSHGRMVAGASCNGEDLQCAYDVPVFNCDGTIGQLESSCSCTDGKWVCPSVVEPVCPVAVPSDPGDAGDMGGAGGTANTATATVQGGSTLYPTGTGASTSASSRASPLRGASCPLIYFWNGTEYQYSTDVGGLTVSLPASATANIAIPIAGASTFYHLLPSARHDSEHGLGIRLRESVREVSYLDEAKLILVDHPENSEVWSSGDESTNEWGYVAPLRIFTGTAPRTPIAATDRLGRDVLQNLSAVDNVPAPVVPDTFENDYTLDFGPLTLPEYAKLVIDGWSVYRYRAPKDVQPYVEAELNDGSWAPVAKFGAPYGDLKAVVVDLGGKLPEGARRLRIHLGMEQGARWVIDRVRIDESAPVATATTVLAANKVDLSFRGRATLNRGSLKSRQDALDDAGPVEAVQLAYGAFTRYGDVGSLLDAVDDRYVIMRHGDQLDLEFPGAPLPPTGWVRSVLLKVDVIMKTFFFDRDVEPLPFHGMSAYPYPQTESYPHDDSHTQYLRDYNTRVYVMPADGGTR